MKREKMKMKNEGKWPRWTAALPWLLVIVLSLVTSTPARAANVQISLQTCGISPAANRNLVLTPLQAEGSGAVPVMDKIQTNTDVNGNAWVTLMPGVYQTDVRPAWGQVGVTEFYFYVDPSVLTTRS